MNRSNFSTSRLLDYVLPSLVLIFLGIYTYAKFFEHPYAGFRLDSSGKVFLIFIEQEMEPFLQMGDQVIEINSVRWEDFRADLRRTILDNVQPGQVINLLVKRGNQEILIPWEFAGPTPEEIRDLVISEGWLAFFFWFAGFFSVLTLRPKDVRWRLFIAFNYLTALFLVLGSGVSFYHIWESAILLRIFVWFCVPVYLHLHWIFPKPLGRLPKVVIWLGYFGAGILSIAEWFQLLPESLYFIGFLLAVVGSIALLIVHAIKQPETRRDLGILLTVLVAAFVPSIAVGIIGGFIENKLGPLHPWISGGALISLSLFPVAYFYAVYRRRLGSLELRVNSLLSSSLFLILVGTLLIPLIILIGIEFSSVGATVIFGTIVFILASIIVLVGHLPFQSFFERRLLGIPLPSKRVLETYSIRITTSTSSSNLVQVLQEEILPSLLIRQFAFLELDQGSLKVLSTMGLNEEQMPTEQDVPYLMTQSSVYRSSDLAGRDLPFPWIRLILPLNLGDQLLGFWLFGRRDPDDIYSQVEIPVLGSLANLTAIALSNILQTERLKTMYETNINRYEQERLHLAHELHDSILNELAALLTSPNAPALSPEFQQAFGELTERLREIVNDLRPPMLAFGLKLALEDFVENLAERNQGSVEIAADIQAGGDRRYPEIVESNLYRIVQQACENALRHARAKRITIFGRLHQREIDIRVEDDGIGFDSKTSLKPDQMLTRKHFGLIGMLERANWIGAELSIHSRPNQGTKVQVIWKSKEPI